MMQKLLSRFKCLLPLYYRIAPYYRNKKLIRTIFCERTGPKELIFCEDDFFVLGGLCDRINGMVSLFKHCKASGIPFKINFVKPFNLQNFLVPNTYNWIVNPSCVNYDCSHLRFIPMLDLNWRNFEHYFSVQEKNIQDIIRKWKKGSMVCWSNAHVVRKEEFSELFFELFKPSKVVQNEIDANIKRIGNEFIGVTIRFQNRLGDFKEADVCELPQTKKDDLIKRCEQKVIEIHLSNPNKKILLTSDSRSFLNIMDRYDFIYTIPGKLIHMSYTLEKDVDSYIKGFVDLLMLSKAETIYLLITDDMWRSGFPETASFIGNRNYVEIRF